MVLIRDPKMRCYGLNDLKFYLQRFYYFRLRRSKDTTPDASQV